MSPLDTIQLARYRLKLLTPRRVAYAAATLWFNGLFYRRTLGGRRGRGLSYAPQDSWPGDARRGAALLKNDYALAGHAETAPEDPWRCQTATQAWLAELHGFEWLRDLRALGGEAARQHGREMVGDWLRREDRWRPLSWRPDVAAQRLTNWLIYAEYVYPVEEPVDAKPFIGSLIRHAKHLSRVVGLLDRGVERLLVLRALVYAAVCLPEQARFLAKWLDMLCVELDIQIAADGGHVTRSPAVQFAMLRHAVELRGLLRDAGLNTPQALQNAIDRMAPMVRFFRHGDGGLCLFNDTNEDENWLIDVVLTRAEARGKPLGAAPHVGFQRLSANRTLVLMDAGPLPPPGFDGHAHAGTLSFEMSVGRQRLIVNCGAYSGARDDWRLAQRTTAAHSTVTIDDYNSAEILNGELIGFRPKITTIDRRESDGNLWVDCAIGDYGGITGLAHRRRLYLSAGGADLRGEDTLSGKANHKFSVRFHLHPSVTASLAQNAESVLLRTSDGGGWRLRATGGVASLQESVYLGLRGEPRRTEQIVVSGAMQSGEAQVKWALTRLSS